MTLKSIRCDKETNHAGTDGQPECWYRFEEEPNVNIPGNKQQATFRRLHDAINTGDAELISKTIDEVVEPDALIRTPLPVGATGAQALKQVMAMLHRLFPDLHLTVEDLIAEGDKVVARNVVTGTHQGEYMGRPPTGKSVAYNESQHAQRARSSTST